MYSDEYDIAIDLAWDSKRMFVEVFFDSLYELTYVLVWDFFFKTVVYILYDLLHGFCSTLYDRFLLGWENWFPFYFF